MVCANIFPRNYKFQLQNSNLTIYQPDTLNQLGALHKKIMNSSISIVQQRKISSLILRNSFIQQQHRFFHRKATTNQQQFNKQDVVISEGIRQRKPHSRDHVSFAWLKSLTEINDNKGKFVTLPILPGTTPKGFNSSISNSFLLTMQRAELLLRVIKEFTVNSDAKDKGMVLCGPVGIGKSMFAYLMAAYAWVNKYPLIYIVSWFFLLLCSNNIFMIVFAATMRCLDKPTHLLR